MSDVMSLLVSWELRKQGATFHRGQMPPHLLKVPSKSLTGLTSPATPKERLQQMTRQMGRKSNSLLPSRAHSPSLLAESPIATLGTAGPVRCAFLLNGNIMQAGGHQKVIIKVMRLKDANRGTAGADSQQTAELHHAKLYETSRSLKWCKGALKAKSAL